jgi:biotin carboxyl carrier protein
VLEGGLERRVVIERRNGGFVVEVDGETYEVDHVHAGGHLHSLVIEGRQSELLVQAEGGGRYRVASDAGEELLEVRDPLVHLAMSEDVDRGGGLRAVNAYMPGRVVAVLVEEGDVVEQGQGVVVLEAMKMENEITSEVDGVVSKIHVSAGQSVEGGDPLFEIGDE